MIGDQAIQWREPIWFLLALYPFLLLLITSISRYLRHEQYSESKFIPWVISHNISARRHNIVRQSTYILAWCCFAAAMAGPRTADKIYQTDHSDYAEVMIVLDLSQSMSAKDVLPNRLVRARLELLDFLQRAEQIRVGLIVFAARPHLLSPATYDKSVIRHYLTALKPALLPTAGSNIEEAIVFASEQFEKTAYTSRAILLISDGNSAGTFTPEQYQKTLNLLKQNNVKIYSLGIGSQTGQAVVAQLDPDYPQPITQTTISSLQRDTLLTLATQTNGLYSDVSDDNSDWRSLYDRGIANLSTIQSATQDANRKILWRELYHIPVILGFVLLILSVISITLKKPNPAAINSFAIILLTLFSLIDSPDLEAAEISYKAAYQAYAKGNFSNAQDMFSQLPGFAARLGEGNAYYQQVDYNNARNIYIQAILIARNNTQRAEALFNLGNTYFHLKEFIKAQLLYRDVLRYQPEYPAAEINISHAQLEQRKKEAEQALTYRAGSGPRTGRAADNLDLSNTQVSLGDSTKEDTELSLPNVNATLSSTSHLLNQAELASQHIENSSDSDWTYRLISNQQLETYRQNLNTNNAYVWQRLFEHEEGFPAPVPLPRPVPGVTPW